MGLDNTSQDENSQIGISPDHSQAAFKVGSEQSANLDDLLNTQANVVDALLGCLLLACRTHHIPTTKDALTAGLPLRNGKMTPALFKRAAERANLAVTTLKKPINQIRTAFLPVTLLLQNDEACQLVSINAKTNQASVIYPELGDAEVLVSLEEIAAHGAQNKITHHNHQYANCQHP